MPKIDCSQVINEDRLKKWCAIFFYLLYQSKSKTCEFFCAMFLKRFFKERFKKWQRKIIDNVCFYFSQKIEFSFSHKRKNSYNFAYFIKILKMLDINWILIFLSTENRFFLSMFLDWCKQIEVYNSICENKQ